MTSSTISASVCQRLLAVLALVPDPRSRRGIRHQLPGVVAVALSTVLAGARSYAAIGQWADDLSLEQRVRVGLTRAYPGRMLGNVQVDAKHNETSHFQEIRTGLELRPAAGPSGSEGVTVVTFDALHTVRANLEWLVTEQKVHYAAVIKKNQPNTYRKTRRLPWKKVRRRSRPGIRDTEGSSPAR
jgi:DDE family transposase